MIGKVTRWRSVTVIVDTLVAPFKMGQEIIQIYKIINPILNFMKAAICIVKQILPGVLATVQFAGSKEIRVAKRQMGHISQMTAVDNR